MFSARRPLVVHAFAVGLRLLAVYASAQDKSPNTVHVAGVVVDAQTDVPIRRARLTTSESESRSTAFTDERGRFAIDAPAGGTLAITKAGYAHATVKVGAELRIPMSRGAAIIGRVVDAVGMPLESATAVVSIVPSSPTQSDERRRTVMTDDLGEFRFGGLAEGVGRVGALRGVVGGRLSRGMEDALATVTAAGAQVRIRAGDVVDVGDVLVEAGLVSDLPAQTNAGSGIVLGAVHDARGRPMKVSIYLTRTDLHPFVTVSDGEGRFRFEHVPPGLYLAEVPRQGAAARQVYIRDGATVAGIDFTVRGGTAISGTIVDEYGDPIEGAAVQALTVLRAGERLAALPSGGRVASSDDRGVYRVFGLSAGRYLVVVDEAPVDTRNPGRNAGIKGGYAPVLYPGTTNAREAAPVALDKGDATDINIAFRREPAMRVTGTALDSSGRPILGGVLLMTSQRSGSIMLEPRSSRAAADGTFSFESVPPGDYVVQATTPTNAARPEPGKPIQVLDLEFGRQYVTITDVDPPPVQIRTSPGATIRGHVRVDGDAAALPSAVTVYPTPTDFDASMVIGMGTIGLKKTGSDTFEVTGVTGSRRFVMMGRVDGWYMKEARVQGVDALDTPFDFGLTVREFDDVEIVLSSLPATISGTVVTPAGKAPSKAAVVVFSTDSDKWYMRSQSVAHQPASADGMFRIANLPPGSYYLVAISDAGNVIDATDSVDPATLDELRRGAMRVDVHEGETRNVTVRVTTER